MIVSEILLLASGIIGLCSTVAGTTACAHVRSSNGKTNIAVLNDKHSTLKILINDLHQKVLTFTGAVIMPNPSAFIEKAQNVLTGLNVPDLQKRLDAKCMIGLLPNCVVQRGAWKSIEEKFLKLDELTKEGQCILEELIVRGFKLPEVTIVGSNRIDTKEEIWTMVSSMDDQVGTICIHGALGVGKTALAMSLHNKALNDGQQRFDYVIWVNVGYGAGLMQIQEDIAKSLSIDLSDISSTCDTVKRARRLNAELSRKKKFLLILDSMWRDFSLSDIGVPDDVNGRLILTSRIRTVCGKIEIKKEFELEPLLGDNAWELFMHEAKNPNLSHLHAETIISTKSAVAELDGLPLAINNLSKTLMSIHDQNPPELVNHAWRKKLAYLAERPIYLESRYPELFNRFEESYKYLKEETKPYFLYCTLFPKDHLIESEELIEYWIGEGLLGGVHNDTLDRAREEGRDALLQLKNAHLLQSIKGESGSKEKVKMLKVVRSMAIHTMVKDQKQVCIRSGGSLTSLPSSGRDWNSKVERASFMKNQLKALERKESYPQLSTLLLQDNPLDLNSDGKFFDSMRKLLVLDLSQTEISTLPKSLSNLKHLQALLLRKCSKLRALPNLSKLNQLIVLDLSGTPLENCPKGIKNMKKLRRLNLSQTKLATFPSKVIGQLTELEELLMITDNNCLWASNEDSYWCGACVEELGKLEKLSVLQLQFLNRDVFKKYLSMAESHTNVPPKFCFRVGRNFLSDQEYVDENRLTICSEPERPDSSMHVISLPKLRDLNLLEVANYSGGYQNLFSVKIVGSLTMLRELRVRSCKGIEKVVLQLDDDDDGDDDDDDDDRRTISLPELTKMVLFDLPKLKSVCHGKTLNCPKLLSVEVWRCEKLKLPIIHSESREIQLKGEWSWLKDYQRRPYFRLDEACIPPELTVSVPSANWLMQNMQGDGSRKADVPHTEVRAFLGVLCVQAASIVAVLAVAAAATPSEGYIKFQSILIILIMATTAFLRLRYNL